MVSNSKPERVVELVNYYEELIGFDKFKLFFGIILLDRGEEFDLYELLETSIFDKNLKRCKVFYCYPMQSNQKPHCENNHALLRRILPKGQSNFDKLTNFDVANLNSHINSYPRKSLGGKVPYNLMLQSLPKKFLDTLGIELVPSKNIILKPSLLRHTQC